MKVKLVGKQIVSYTQKQTGEVKEGISLFYTAPKAGVQGECTSDIWIRKGTPLYDQMLAQDIQKPVHADIHYEVMPGSRYPVLSEVKVLA